MGRKPIWPPRPHVHQRDNVECICIQGIHYPLGKPGSQEAKQEYARLIAEFTVCHTAIPRRSSESAPLVAEVVAAFLNRPGQRNRSDADRECLALSVVVELYGDHPARSFGPVALAVCRDRLTLPGRSRSYINRLTNTIRSAWKYAVSLELVAVDQWTALKTLPPLKIGETTAHETEPVMPCDPQDVAAVLPHLPTRVAAMVQLQMLTGARPSEICRMRAGEVHRDGKIQLSRGKTIDLSTYGIWVYSPSAHKTQRLGKERHLLIGPQAKAILEPWLVGKQDHEPVFSPYEAREERFFQLRLGRKSKVQPSQVSRKKVRPKRTPGSMYTSASYGRCIARACKKAQIPVWTPYQLRHLMATEVREEADLEAAQAVLGHDDPNTTLIYALRSFRKAAELIGRIG